MKILFVASNPDRELTLDLERQISQIQQRLALIFPALAPIEFRSLPDAVPDQLLEELQSHPPDVLHLSAQMAKDPAVVNEGGERLWISDDGLESLLRALPVRPRLVYVNACRSAETASVLTKNAAVEFAIGASIPLLNRHAIMCVAALYDWMARGHSIQAAFEAGRAVLDVLAGQPDTLSLYGRPGADPHRAHIRALPRIIARVPRWQTGPHTGQLQLERKSDGYYHLEYGLLNCPSDTMQAVFFVSDSSFLPDDEDDTPVETALCTLVRAHPWPRAVWLEGQWESSADYYVYATAIRANGEAFTIRSTPSEALSVGVEKEVHGQLKPPERERFAKIVDELRGVVR